MNHYDINYRLDNLLKLKKTLDFFGITLEGEAKYNKILKKMIKEYFSIHGESERDYVCVSDYCKLRGKKIKQLRCSNCGNQTKEFHSLPSKYTLYGIGLTSLRQSSINNDTNLSK